MSKMMMTLRVNTILGGGPCQVVDHDEQDNDEDDTASEYYPGSGP